VNDQLEKNPKNSPKKKKKKFRVHNYLFFCYVVWLALLVGLLLVQKFTIRQDDNTIGRVEYMCVETEWSVMRMKKGMKKKLAVAETWATLPNKNRR
jgi:hypothetical protein